MKVSLFYLPSVGSRPRSSRDGGLRGDLYQRMLFELKEQAQAADELGYDSISFTEHHFHVEGFELSNNPVLLDLYIAMQTKRIRVGQLGIVLPAQNPIRVAEDIAMLDHMTGGRANAGFARLPAPLGRHHGAADCTASTARMPHQHDAIDAANRAAFEEHFRIIKKAWTEDMLSYQRGSSGRSRPSARPGRSKRRSSGAPASTSRASSARSAWCRSRCRSRTRRSSSRSRPARTRSAGAPART